jgi:quercetin dioxygenase-like cupin family protein/heme-degrading monooxygenase HmoA
MMEIVDLKSREVFGQEGRGVALIVDEPYLTIRQVGLEPGREVPVHTADAPVTIQVIRGEGTFSAEGQSLRMGPGKLLRIAQGAEMGVVNHSGSPLVFLVVKTPLPEKPVLAPAVGGQVGSFVNLVDFAPVKPPKQEAFLEWFRRSSEIFTKHRGFISRTLLEPMEGGHRYAAIVEHESKETFMDMHLSDDRQELFQEVEPMVMGASKPHFYQLVISYRK